MKISKIKIERFLAMTLCVVVTVLAFSLPAVAQDDKGRDRGGRDDRGGRGSRDRDIEREKWKQNFDLKGYLNKLDYDNSGVLDGKELRSDRTRSYLSKLGIDPNSPVKIESAVKKAAASLAKKRDAERKKFEDQVRPKLTTFGTETETMGLNAFGTTEAKEPTVATFDERLSGLKMTDFDEKTTKEARKILGGYDRDKSGFLEGDEISRIRWEDPKPAESDLNGDGRISLLEMAQRLQNKNTAREKQSDLEYRDYESGKRGYDRKNSQGRRPEKGSFGKSSASSSGKASVPGSRSSKGGSRSTNSANGGNAFANYIDGVYKKYDTDGDQRLSQDELSEMRRPLKGDTDNDGFLSKSEATQFIKDGKTKKNTPKIAPSSISNDSGDGGRGTPGKGPGDVASRKYTPPKSAKSRGKAKSKNGAKSRGSLGNLDANSDGQIEMAEYSKTWNEATLQKFRKTDTNQDGIISADEWSSRSK